MTDERARKLERLQVASLRQGGLLLREIQMTRKDAKDHAREDARIAALLAEKDAELATKQAEMKNEISWIKKAGMLLYTLTIGHWFLK